MKRIVLYLLSWKIFIYFILFFSLATLPLQFDYLGGGILEYLKNPYVWPFVNFDGVHYLSLAYEGYKPLTYFYFPLFPLTVKYASIFIQRSSLEQIVTTGLWINNLFILTAIFGLYKLIKIDYTEKIAILTIIILLIFPTSFYFSAFYNESLFLMLSVWCIYFARIKKWIFAGILGGLATATRVVGLALIPALIAEIYFQWKKSKKFSYTWFISLLISGSGIFLYAIYLYLKTGNPLEFFHSVGIFGQQRSSTLISLLQVFYRYFFKILPSINYEYFPVVVSTYLELYSALLFVILTIVSFIKLRLSYALYSFTAFIIPTLSGSFSSLPRYILVIYPAFLLMAIYISERKISYKIIYFVSQFVLLAVTASLYFRGYWIS